MIFFNNISNSKSVTDFLWWPSGVTRQRRAPTRPISPGGRHIGESRDSVCVLIKKNIKVWSDLLGDLVAVEMN